MPTQDPTTRPDCRECGAPVPCSCKEFVAQVAAPSRPETGTRAPNLNEVASLRDAAGVQRLIDAADRYADRIEREAPSGMTSTVAEMWRLLAADAKHAIAALASPVGETRRRNHSPRG